MQNFHFILFMILRRTLFQNFTIYVAPQPIKLSTLDKSLTNVENYSINISVKKSIIPNETAEIANFHFSHYKSMETLSFHSNASSLTLTIKVKSMQLILCRGYFHKKGKPGFSFILLIVSERKNFEYFSKFTMYVTLATNQN